MLLGLSRALHQKGMGEFANLTDYENYLLECFDARAGVPRGMERLSDERWVAHVRADLPDSDFTWEQYEAYVRAGLGDDWFFHMAASAASPASLASREASSFEAPSFSALVRTGW